MARAPFQVLVYPYLQVDEAKFEYALLCRADEGWWQGVAGGGEDDETPLEAARRETYEETGIRDAPFLQLDTVFPVPVTTFSYSHIWSEDVYVIPQHCFGVRALDRQIVLSHEHTAYRWLSYEEAYRLARYDGNKTALWELDRRLRGLGPRDG